MVKNGDGTTVDYKFYSYQNDLSDISATDCTGSAAFSYIDIVGKFLFLHDPVTPAYVVCKYDPAGASTPITLTVTGVLSGTIALFDPFMSDDEVVYVLLGNGVQNQIVSYDTTSGTTITGT